jgi:peptidoglycan hydrolase CwlO-like protein
VLVVIASAPVVGLATSTATASADTVGQLNASIDHVAQQWFDAQATVQQLDADIADHAQRIATLSAQATKLKAVARVRAVDLYTGKNNSFAAVLDGTSALDSARRMQIIERANDKSTQTFQFLDELTTQLRTEHDQLVRQRDQKQSALDALASSRASLDAQLSQARAVAAQQAAAASNRAARTASRSKPPAAVQVPARLEPATAPPHTGAPVSVVVPAPPPNTATFPMHNHPFLVCTRAHESNGIYSVVSPSGLYFGAYQFARETWDVTAIHAGRSDLVGVLPNTASEYDQDALAWALYQWQGNTPWNGRC